MAKLTLLQIVQRVLSAIDSDEVTEVGETVESEQVAELVRTVYDDIISDFPWYHKRGMVSLEATATAHILSIPDNVEQLMSDIIYYDDREVFFIPAEKMQYKLKNRDTSLSNVDTNGAINDALPTYWSTYDDENIVFDSYDGSLVAASSEVWAASYPTAPATDTDVPDLPHTLHQALLWGALEEAFRTLKGDEVAATKYQGKARRVKAKAKRWASKHNKKARTNEAVDYGRRRGATGRHLTSSNRIIDGS